MKEIKLTQGKIALVDDEDFEYINKIKWYAHKRKNTYYAVSHINIGRFDGRQKQIKIYMHRVITNAPDNKYIDHKNHDGLDNQKDNLRIVTPRENRWNIINQSEYIGVTKIGNRYQSKIHINGKNTHIGMFSNPKDANIAYMNMAEKLNK